MDEAAVGQFLEIARINRHAIFGMDSDLAEPNQPLAPYKSRIITEFEAHGEGFTWVTTGRMIENYLHADVFLTAYKAVHPRSTSAYRGDPNSNPFQGGVKQPQ